MGAGSGLGVVLHAEGGQISAAQSLDDPVVEIDVGHLGGAQRVGGHRIVVILRGDLHSSRRQPLDRVVPPVVAERELVGGGTQSAGQQLMAQADPEDGHGAVIDQSPHLADDPGQGCRVTGAVRQEDPVRAEVEHRVGRGGSGYHGNRGQVSELADHGFFDAEVVGHHPVRATPPSEHRRSGHCRDQVASIGRNG